MIDSVIFSILISNTDDHLRNHGFLLYDYHGWILSPAYDINPTPIDIKPRYLTTAIDEYETQASVELLLETSSFYGISLKEAQKLCFEAAEVVKNWRQEALSFSFNNSEIERMSSAFEHADLKKALSLII